MDWPEMSRKLKKSVRSQKKRGKIGVFVNGSYGSPVMRFLNLYTADLLLLVMHESLDSDFGKLSN